MRRQDKMGPVIMIPQPADEVTSAADTLANGTPSQPPSGMGSILNRNSSVEALMAHKKNVQNVSFKQNIKKIKKYW